MTGLAYFTPYTPIFPSDPVDNNTEEIAFSSDGPTQFVPSKPYMESLKERYLDLASLPEVLCPPSRAPSPKYQDRVLSVRKRISKAREKGLSAELSLTCVALKGGDWANEATTEEDERDIAAVFPDKKLPETDEEWFSCQKKLECLRDKRKAAHAMSERRAHVVHWIGGVPVGSGSEQSVVLVSAPPSSKLSEYVEIGTQFIDRFGGPDDPVERTTSPPPAPKLDMLGSFSEPNSQVIDYPMPSVNTDGKISFAPLPSLPDGNTQTTRPSQPTHIVQQLSSPISPPRWLQPLKPSEEPDPSSPVSAKRKRDNFEQENDGVEDSQVHTPIKRPKTSIAPITPVSVARPSQEQRRSQSTRLPANIKSATTTRRYKSATPPIEEVELSQPSYSHFRPQFESTQRPQMESPSSPALPGGSLNMPLSSGGAVYYQSQFNVQQNVDKITDVLRRDAQVFSLEST